MKPKQTSERFFNDTTAEKMYWYAFLYNNLNVILWIYYNTSKKMFRLFFNISTILSTC
jgi:hypothetical protein